MGKIEIILDNIIGVCVVIIYFSITISVIIWKTRFFSLSWINPFSLVLLMGIGPELCRFIIGPIVLMEKGLGDPWYQKAVWMCSIEAVAEFFVYYIVFNLAKYKRIEDRLFPLYHRCSKIPAKRYIFSASLFLILYVILFLFTASYSFGIINWLINPREGYAHHLYNVGWSWFLSFWMLTISYTMYSIGIRRNLYFYLATVIALALSYESGSKGNVLGILLLFLIIDWVRGSKYTVRLLFFSIFIGFALIVNIFFSTNVVKDGIDPLTALASYFDYFPNSALFYEEVANGNFQLFHGEIFLSHIWSAVPRLFYPDKPTYYGITYINEYFWPGVAETGYMPAFGGPVESYADFGLFGVIILTIFNIRLIVSALFLYILFKGMNLNVLRSSSIHIQLFVFFFASSSLGLLIPPLNLVAFIFPAFTIHLFLKSRIYKTGINI